ncbi:DUF805 domain-containing protein [Ligilactobacillus cholophilus]|uniref:DUF805 domain-containing protein n=1 Tax=Ligilactobacillus cholophilus TaxID=3050131 RepID=UPI0025AF4DEC|nr:DUF805 domain-containing protein [Ligilactobacillus cholophilus]
MKKINEQGKTSFTDAFSHYWKGLFNFNGRSSSSGYWWGQLSMLLGLVAQYTIFIGFYQSMIVSGINIIGTIGSIIIIIIMCWILVASLALFVRRMNDVGIKMVPALVWLVIIGAVLLLGESNLIFDVIEIILFVIQGIICSKGSDELARDHSNAIFRAK